MRLNLASITDNNVFLDLHKRTDKTIVSDLAFIKIDRLDNRNIGPKFNISYLNMV